MQLYHNPYAMSFASDNYSGIHPVVLEAIALANGGHETAYGNDGYTKALDKKIMELFGDKATCYPVFNGTGANVMALQALLPRFGAVICTKQAHIHNDENIAPEYIAGTKIIAIDSDDGKLNSKLIKNYLSDSEHNAQIKAVYISQVTELGTCYTLDELSAIGKTCRELGLYFYVDGARLSNAVAYLDCTLGDIAKTGVDMLSLGGTKNGLMIGELLVVLNPVLDEQMKHLRKINMHLGSKMRFISVQFLAWLEHDLWLQLARHSNQMAQYLAKKLTALDGVQITQQVQSNAVFVILPPQTVKSLQDQYPFYVWQKTTGEVRLMTSFDTTQVHIDDFVQALINLM